MDARALAATALLVAVCPAVAVSATFKTDNFVVTAPTQEFAEQVGKAAEYYRHYLAIVWLGEPLPGKWSQPCPIKCKVGQIGAGGATTFTFNNGHVFGWDMSIQGTEQRILDSVLPHEISHMIFACHFRRPLPRWADEGAATLVEHESERMRQTKLLGQVLRSSNRIPLNQLLSMKEYPTNMQDVLTLYAEGYSLADYLVQKKGKDGRAAFLAFLGDALEHGSWPRAFQTHYGISSIHDIEHEWTQWVAAGSPMLPTADGPLIAQILELEDRSRAALANNTDSRAEIRGQSPETTHVPADPRPLPTLNRPRREQTIAVDLAAPQPGALHLASTGDTFIDRNPAPPISVHPARPASPPEEQPRWQFPWQRRNESADAGNQFGFSDPRNEGISSNPQQFDFSR